ncbi:RNA polymerase 1 specific transcription initiation factor [Sporothrix schenckii 1099-18]|uniref:RNA polymerase 1 specific transcription initiation factor n=1 Tax=Sporothrix schenckii 1099-18 TaxID=1397361 RepID=A0A0F2LRC0_SPOSC|nr:RNA polymerase 1 specific transcription initiation factor [Sporothrix schenckii 1099-18]KJR80078.1 RNA polymerase 1 specific transcription initiation factor [Sporothrix schenckii 1099-18]
MLLALRFFDGVWISPRAIAICGAFAQVTHVTSAMRAAGTATAASTTSYVPTEHEEEGNYGNRGHTARRQKEVREREARHLSGIEARELFLECLQLLLRKQVVWLQQHERQLRGDGEASTSAQSPMAGLESAVRDLWDLRIRYFHGLTVTALADADPRNHGSRSLSRSRSRSQSRATNGTQSGSESDGRTAYSSQQASDTEGGYTSGGSRLSQRRARSRSARKWQSGPDERWNVPGVIETLAICYLGGVLLQLPFRIGDFYRWARNDKIPFLDATKHIPKIMRDRLPPSYLSALTTKLPSLVRGELHEAVVNLVKGFRLNNELHFPGLNVPPILWKWTRDLGLPKRPRLYLVDHPDVFLLSTMILVTKLLYPFNNVDDAHVSGSRQLHSNEDGSTKREVYADDERTRPQHILMDWRKWQAVFNASPKRLPVARQLERHGISKLRARDAWSLTEDQIDDYLDWHQQYRLTEKDDPRHMLRLFPLQEIRPRTPFADEPEEALDSRYRLVQETCLVIPSVNEEQTSQKVKGKRPVPIKDEPTLQHLHDHPINRYREESDLSEAAHAFYSRAANLAGITVQALVREVSRLERRWMTWDANQAKRSSNQLHGDRTDDSAEEDVTMVVDDDEGDGDGDGEQYSQSFAHLYMPSSPPG